MGKKGMGRKVQGKVLKLDQTAAVTSLMASAGVTAVWDNIIPELSSSSKVLKASTEE